MRTARADRKAVRHIRLGGELRDELAEPSHEHRAGLRGTLDEAGGELVAARPSRQVELAEVTAQEVGDAAQLEASGGVSLATLRAIAATGVHAISIGALTHSARTLDLSLLLDPDG